LAESLHQNFYAPQSEGARPFVSQSFSIESIILQTAAKAELEFQGKIPEELGAALATRAKEDYDCDSLARSFVLRASTEQWSLPLTLHDFAKAVVNHASPPKKRGNSYFKIRHRNLIGGAALIVLTNKKHGFGLYGTRSTHLKAIADSEAEKSACELLIDATKGAGFASITPSAADEIWRNRLRLWTEWRILLGILALRQDGKLINSWAALELVRQLDELGASGPSGRKAKYKPGDS